MPPRASRLATALLAIVVLAGLVWWLGSGRELAHEDLGRALSLAGHPATTDLLVEREPGVWSLRREAPLGNEARWIELPSELIGSPVLDGRGAVVARGEQGIARFNPKDGLLSWSPLPLEASAETLFIGVDASGAAVLRDPHSDGDRLYVGQPERGWLLLADKEDRARVPADARLVLSPTRRALAFRGLEGWEAWIFDEAKVRRLVAPRRFGDAAVFTPDGAALIVDGVVDGLDRLELDEERMRFMAEGNLGLVERLPFYADFRGDPPLLVASRRDLQGNLQIHQAHLGGGGGYGFTTGYLHHYLPRVSPDGIWLSYAQAEIAAQGGDDFREELYLFDFSRPARPAQALGARSGGRADTGPVFLGERQLVWIADGRLRLVRLQPALPLPE